MTGTPLDTLTSEQLLAVFVFLMTHNPTAEQADALAQLYNAVHADPDPEPGPDPVTDHYARALVDTPARHTSTHRLTSGSSPRFGVYPTDTEPPADN